MSKGKTGLIVLLVVVIVLAVAFALRHEAIMDNWHRIFPMDDRAAAPSSDDAVEQQATGDSSAASDSSTTPVRRAVPKKERQAMNENTAAVLPPPPPLPQVPVEASEPQRKEAFGLKSLDHIVLRDEPFEVAGRSYTIGGIQSGLQKTTEPPAIVPEIQEKNIGSAVRRPIRPGAPQNERVYYGVRIVRPYENIWKIHFGVLQEYLARRQVILAKGADRPLAHGLSSGVGRLLKFIEAVVTVYDVDENRVEKDINLVHPHSAIVFFKITDLFTALDRMQPEDLKWLRYVKGSIRVDRSRESVEIINRDSFAE